MTPKKNRLTKKAIKQTLKLPYRASSDFFNILYKCDAESKLPRISITVSKKVAKTAVLRNRLRRIGYSALKPLILKVLPGFVALIQYKNGVNSPKTEDIKIDIENLLKKAKAFK